MMNLTSKLPHVGTTIFTVMSKLANEQNAINLSQGFPGFVGDKHLQDLVAKHMNEGKNQYAPMPGVIELREQLCTKINGLYNSNYNAEEITITAGATQAIYTAITTVVNKGDEVIVFDPAYDCYEPAIELNGGKTIHLQLKHPNYSIDFEALEAAINNRTRLIIINSPHNPTGSLISGEQMLKLEALLKDTNIFLISDEVYEHITYDDKPHESASKYTYLKERSFIISSFGKTFHNTGWKMGYCTAPKYLMVEFKKVHQFLVFSCNTPMQYALAEYLKDEIKYLELPSFYQKKRDIFRGLIKNSRFKLLDCNGTYFQLLDYSNITDEKDVDFAIRLTKEFKVASIPISVFYNNKEDNKVLRFCFAKQEETLIKAAEVLCKI